ncbi:uncharacterized protein EDB93DRAFT_1247129 [Suillus bovinus]|uniref:uncharacterized protein n=1 Tax=Suillus bovinus TaxID=48563 RepID=UPI001B87305E|nr:uncharacterized protein EDB93DRAFT_1247129 [Suillus bovinus]KAG2156950.1 hypothetical protein EDB93DRAFT_1247129 [Suillus bovinus]
MSTSVVPQDDFLAVVWSIRVLNYSDGVSSRTVKQKLSDNGIVVVVAALWIYDLLSTFQQEATFLAQANTNIAKFLYIGARYIPLFIRIPNLIFDKVPGLGNADCQSLDTLNMIAEFCAESIFILRTCAMWEVKRPVRWVMFVIIACVSVAGIIMFIFVPREDVFVPDIMECQPLQIAKTPRLLVALLALLMLELVLVILTAIRAVKNYRPTPTPLLTLLLTHHLFYYGCGLLFSTINVLCVALFKYEYAAIFFSPQIIAHALLATRMHYRLWESENIRNNDQSEQHPMSSLVWEPPEDIATA